VEWLRDVSPATWIRARLHPFAQDVGSVIPEGFAAYCRLFHPVERWEAGARRRERWSELAERNGRIVHREMQYHMISRPRGRAAPVPDRSGHQTSWGSLPIEERRLLVGALRDRTDTPDRCWFSIWEGFGGLDDRGVHERVELPGRRYLLYAGPVELATANPLDFDQSPNLWWPDDRAWFVATEIDLAWTYIGGTRSLIDSLVSSERLEVLRAELSDKPFYDSDRPNAALDDD